MKGRPARAQAAPATYLEMPVGEFLEALSAARPDPGGGSTAALTVTLAASLCMMAASLSGYQLPQAEHVAEEARRLRDRAAPLAQADAEGYRKVLAAMREPAGPAAPGSASPGPASPGSADPGPAAGLDADQPGMPGAPGDGAGGPARSRTGGPADGEAPAAWEPDLLSAPPDGTYGEADEPSGRRERRIADALSEACTVPLEVAQIGARVAALAADVAADGNPAVRGDAVTAALLASASTQAAATLVRINLAGARGDQRPAQAEALAAEAARLAGEASRAAG